MKTPSLKRFGLSLLVFLSISVAGRAQGGHHFNEGRPGSREIKAYVEANVQPVLRQQRQKLEQQLAPADRTQLATYRAQLKTLREKGKALHQSLQPADVLSSQRPILTDAQREQFYQVHREMRAVMSSVGEMAQKYKGNLAKLAEEMQPQKEKWATDINGIVMKNATPEQQEYRAKFGGHLHGLGEMRHFFRPVAFLLLEPVATENTERSLGATSFYPNPVTATAQLDYEVKKAGSVTVNLLDQSGSQLRTLLNEPNAEKGAHTQPLSLSDLPAGTYYYQIVTDGNKETKRFVKE